MPEKRFKTVFLSFLRRKTIFQPLHSRVHSNTNPFNMLSQGLQFDKVKQFNVEPISQRQLIQLGSDAFSPQPINVAPKCQINIGNRCAIAFCTRAEYLSFRYFRVLSKHADDHLKLVRAQRQSSHCNVCSIK